jgi:hypothetical protein
MQSFVTLTGRKPLTASVVGPPSKLGRSALRWITYSSYSIVMLLYSILARSTVLHSTIQSDTVQHSTAEGTSLQYRHTTYSNNLFRTALDGRGALLP